MKNRQSHVKRWLMLLALTTCWWAGTRAAAQTLPAQNGRSVQDNDTTRQELAQFDQFLDSHREISEQLRSDPARVNNEKFVQEHPALQTYLQDHPQIREEITENPNAFMQREARFDQQEAARSNLHEGDRDTTRRQVAQFDQFLDSHREISEQLRSDPARVNNEKFVQEHPALQTYLQDHPEIREEIKENPNAFMQREARFDQQEAARSGRPEGDRDTTRRGVAQFDQFLDSHREISEQLRSDPARVNNEKFVNEHPALQTYLQNHPEIRQQIQENPNAFMQREARYDQHEDGMNRDMTRRPSASFGEFLGGHSNIAQQLSRDPSLATNREYTENHPELREYLNGHPDVRQQLLANPQGFVKSAQQSTTTPGSEHGLSAPTTAEPKPIKP